MRVAVLGGGIQLSHVSGERLVESSLQGLGQRDSKLIHQVLGLFGCAVKQLGHPRVPHGIRSSPHRQHRHGGLTVKGQGEEGNVSRSRTPASNNAQVGVSLPPDSGSPRQGSG